MVKEEEEAEEIEKENVLLKKQEDKVENKRTVEDQKDSLFIYYLNMQKIYISASYIFIT